MAQKNTPSRAEKAVSEAKKKNAGAQSGASSKSAPKKPTSPKKTPAVKTEYDKPALPTNAIVAIVSLILFVVFVVMAAAPEGALTVIFKSVILGLIGQVGFYFTIPALLFLFVLHTFGRKTAVKMRSICAIAFVLLCGCIYHLAVQTQGMAQGMALLADLYTSGIDGRSGGVICGGIAMLIRWACGSWLSYIVLILLAVITLLGAMQMTIPSIIRAIINRPRDDWEDEEDAYLEPAAVVVNHIANKQIEHKRQRRQRLEEARSYPEEQPENLPQAAVKKQKPKPAAPAPTLPAVEAEEESITTGTPSNAAGVMSTIDLDIGAPVAAAGEYVQDKPERTPPRILVPEVEEPIPQTMPELDLTRDLPTAPVMEPIKPKTKKEKDPKQQEAKSGKVSSKDTATAAAQVAQEIAETQAVQKPMYCFPPIDLLKRPPRGGADGTEEMRENSRRLNETLQSFKIDAHITNVTRGPSVTRYEVELDKGVRLSKLTGCADDIALSLGASGVRIAAVPGKISIVGIEVPNRAVTTVSLREVIDSDAFASAKAKASFSVGKSIDGNCIVGNIGKMPHMLIAGTTGSGKSVCMNSIIISLLYKASPEDVKLIMVDPKMVELGIYNGIPHLLIPVVTDPKKAAGSLQWAVVEMMRRYKMMSDMGVRDLESYNSIVTAEEDGQKLPQVVIIIDELADLMMVAAKEVEDSICRIAQMGRAAGMHLIIATQRPSADVITGLMKANIPSRIAFSVASAMESRIILDTMGAEKLVGKGDMLYAPIGSGKPLRVQGCFVTDAEVEAVAGYVKENYVANYDDEVLKEIEKSAAQTGKKTPTAADPDPSDEELEGDEMLPAAVDVILETGQASVSMLQRRLKLGYARAARIVDEMEEKGIVGPFQGSKPRSILITKEQWAAMQGGNQQMDFDDLDDFDGVPEEID